MGHWGSRGRCGVLVDGSGRVVLPMPVPAPCNVLVMVGAGTSFVEGFVVTAEAIVSTGTGSGRSCGTDCCGLHPPAQCWVSNTKRLKDHRRIIIQVS